VSASVRNHHWLFDSVLEIEFSFQPHRVMWLIGYTVYDVCIFYFFILPSVFLQTMFILKDLKTNIVNITML